MRQRFSNQRGVTVRILDYGRTASAPFYETLYQALVAAGYVRDQDIRVAGYDARLTPDMGGFLRRTKKLIERPTAPTAAARCSSSATPTARFTRSTC